MSTPLRAALTAALFVSLGVACDGDDGSTGNGEPPGKPVSREVVTAAAGRTVSAGSATVDGEVALDTAETAVTITIEGASDFQTGAGVITLTFNVDEGPPTGASDVGAVEIRSIDRSTAFANYGEFLDAPETPWVSFTAADVGVTPQNFAGGNPLAVLDFLQAIVGRPVEGESFDGAPGDDVTRYDVTLDLEQLLEPAVAAALDPSTAAEVRRITELVHGPINGEVFIDTEGRVTQFQYAFEVEVDGESLYASSRIRFRDFGTSVTVTPPPPEEVRPYAEAADELDQLGEGPLPVATD
ncbi:MAG: hypothetical protein ACT4PI_15645 [Actinomycetota bacterium]